MKNTPFILKHYKTAFLIGSIAFVAVCCKSTQPASTNNSTAATKSSGGPAKFTLAPIESDVAIAGKRWPGTTLDYLNQGYSIFESKCTDCHEAKMPQNFAEDDWNSIMPKMGRKAKLDSTEYNKVFHYILTKREETLEPWGAK